MVHYYNVNIACTLYGVGANTSEWFCYVYKHFSILNLYRFTENPVRQEI